MINSYTLGVLKELERGKINIDEANARLNAKPINADASAFKPELPGWVRLVQLYAFILGTLTVLFGAWIIVTTVHANIAWLVLGLPIMLLGALVLSLGGLFSSMHWIYINIERAHGHPRTIHFAIPFPFSLLRVGLWLARFVIPNSKARVGANTRNWRWDAIWGDLNGFLNALEREFKQGRGISVNVDDQGQRVQLYWLESNALRRDGNNQSNARSSGSDPSPLNGNQLLFESNHKIDDSWSEGWAGY